MELWGGSKVLCYPQRIKSVEDLRRRQQPRNSCNARLFIPKSHKASEPRETRRSHQGRYESRSHFEPRRGAIFVPLCISLGFCFQMSQIHMNQVIMRTHETSPDELWRGHTIDLTCTAEDPHGKPIRKTICSPTPCLACVQVSCGRTWFQYSAFL